MGDFSKEIQSKFESERVKAYLNIKYTANWLSNIAEKYFSEFGISAQQYNVLWILRGAKKAVTVSTVKERMIEKAPSITRLMDKLCSKNLIQRSRSDQDRRTVYAEITTEGLNLLSKIDKHDKKLDMDAISETEALELNRILDKIR